MTPPLVRLLEPALSITRYDAEHVLVVAKSANGWRVELVLEDPAIVELETNLQIIRLAERMLTA